MMYRRFAQVAQSRENLDVIKIVVVHPIGCAIGPRGLIRWREIIDSRCYAKFITCVNICVNKKTATNDVNRK